jgi:predicted alpha/beta superfamily hydrolase
MVRRRKRPHALTRPTGSPSGGCLRIDHDGFPSEVLGNRRRLTVLLPPGYDRGSAHYPVLYLNDGQNLFEDHEAAFGVSWRAQATAERLILAGRVSPFILVGIANTPARLDEYAPYLNARGTGGRGDLYGRFVLDEVKPFVDAAYRTLPDRKHTAVGGSSLGGLISLYLAWRWSEQVGQAVVMSPSLWWDDSHILRDLEGPQPWLKKGRFWLDVGTREGRGRDHVPPTVQHTRELLDLFDANGLVPGRHYYYWEVAGGEHNEAAWGARFDKVLLFLFGT